MSYHPGDEAAEHEPYEPYYVVRDPDLPECYRVLCDGRPGYRSPPMTLECATREADRANGRVAS